jgi:hypothetical protein
MNELFAQDNVRAKFVSTRLETIQAERDLKDLPEVQHIDNVSRV